MLALVILMKQSYLISHYWKSVAVVTKETERYQRVVIASQDESYEFLSQSKHLCYYYLASRRWCRLQKRTTAVCFLTILRGASRRQLSIRMDRHRCNSERQHPHFIRVSLCQLEIDTSHETLAEQANTKPIKFHYFRPAQLALKYVIQTALNLLVNVFIDCNRSARIARFFI